MKSISAEELHAKLAEGQKPFLLDVREELEFHTFNIGGENIPLGSLIQSIDELEINPEEEIVVICQRGIRSLTACGVLEAAGYTQVLNLKDGLLGWQKHQQSS
ncbi:MAG: rhodanese-like domain-containing protein [Sphingobacteriaceae bacterium]